MSTRQEIISKTGLRGPLAPNLLDYKTARRSFSWEAARRELDGLPGGGLNIAHETIDRHAEGPRANQVAMRFIGKNGHVRDFTYARLRDLTNRFANVLRSLGVGKADRVFVYMGRLPELYITALGALKNGSVFCPLFSAFGPEPLQARLHIGGAKVLVTTTALYRRRMAVLQESLPCLKHVLLVDEEGDRPNDVLRFNESLDTAAGEFAIEPTDPEDWALLHFTSGTSGKPKGAVHVHAAVIAHHITAKLALDLHSDDVYWCTADPGWVTGTSYGFIAPLSIGATVIVDEGGFEPEHWYRILEEQHVTVWYTAPTAIRMLMRMGKDLASKYDLKELRFMASVGEPLNPEAVRWGQEALGRPFHDNWWQTETGCIVIANFAAMDIKPGSMGRPLPGVEAAIVRRDKDKGIELVSDPDTIGELAIQTGWPSMFRGYLDEDARYGQCFVDGWYLTGDLARRDADGYFWFVGRADDIINSSGHLISPFEVESVIMEHPAVADVGVIGKPDVTAMEVAKACIELKPGVAASDTLRRELLGLARKRLGSAIAPKTIEFQDKLPRTRSGKIMRRLLKARELGASEGDVSTLETDE